MLPAAEGVWGGGGTPAGSRGGKCAGKTWGSLQQGLHRTSAPVVAERGALGRGGSRRGGEGAAPHPGAHRGKSGLSPVAGGHRDEVTCPGTRGARSCPQAPPLHVLHHAAPTAPHQGAGLGPLPCTLTKSQCADGTLFPATPSANLPRSLTPATPAGCGAPGRAPRGDTRYPLGAIVGARSRDGDSRWPTTHSPRATAGL